MSTRKDKSARRTVIIHVEMPYDGFKGVLETLGKPTGAGALAANMERLLPIYTRMASDPKGAEGDAEGYAQVQTTATAYALALCVLGSVRAGRYTFKGKDAS